MQYCELLINIRAINYSKSETFNEYCHIRKWYHLSDDTRKCKIKKGVW